MQGHVSHEVVLGHSAFPCRAGRPSQVLAFLHVSQGRSPLLGRGYDEQVGGGVWWVLVQSVVVVETVVVRNGGVVGRPG